MAENEKYTTPVKPTESVKVETTPTPTFKNIESNPKDLQQKVLDEILLKYGVDLTDFVCDKENCKLLLLKSEVTSTQEEQFIEKKAREIYSSYIEDQLKQGKIKETVNLETVTKSIKSQRIESLKAEYDKIIDVALNNEKFDYFDDQTKSFLKLGIANSILNSSSSQVGESLIGGINNFIQGISNIDPNNLNTWLENKNQKSQDSGRTLALEEQFKKTLGEYFQKFEDLEKKFKDKNITNKEQKQNILSHVDWFRNPALIEKGPDGLDIDKIDFTKITKNNTPLDTKSLSEYMVNSRENLVSLSKKLELGDNAGNLLYGIINQEGMIGDGVKGLIETILELPILGKLLAIFLGLDPNNALQELGENSNNFKLLNSLKSLGQTIDKDGNIKKGEKPFEDLDLSTISFNVLKKEIKEVKNIMPEIQELDYKNIWIKAFSEEGYGEKEPKLKFEITQEQKYDKKISNNELKEIFKNGVNKYKSDIQTKKDLESVETLKNKEENQQPKPTESGQVLTDIQTEPKSPTETENMFQKFMGQTPVETDTKYKNLVEETPVKIKPETKAPIIQIEPTPAETPENKEKLITDITKALNGITKETSLVTGVEIGEGKKVTFDKTTQQLSIGNDKFQLRVENKYKPINLRDILINGKNIVLINEFMIKKDVEKDKIINGLKEAIEKGYFNNIDDEGTGMVITKLS